MLFKGDYMILSKIIISISLLAKNLMANLTCMNNKNLNLCLGLGQPSFLSFCYAPDLDSNFKNKIIDQVINNTNNKGDKNGKK